MPPLPASRAPTPPATGRSWLSRLARTGRRAAARGERPFWLVLAVVLGLGLWLAVRLPFAALRPRNAVAYSAAATYALLALCCLSVGGGVGFLFGIPHGAASARPGAADAASRYQPSTNLEQIADWLTKIIIGLSLVEASSLGDRLAQLGQLVAQAAGGSAVVPQLVVVLFAVLGLLAAYVWTRLYYASRQVAADATVQQQLQAQVHQLARRQQRLLTTTEQLQTQHAAQGLVVADLATGRVASAAPAGPVPPGPAAEAASARHLGAAATDNPAATDYQQAWQAQLARFMAAPSQPSDPAPAIFGTPPASANGRQLRVQVLAALATGLYLQATLEATGPEPLGEEVVFVLSPAYPQRTHTVPPLAGSAQLNFFATSSFTLVAMTDGGRTVLSFPLAALFAAASNAPSS